jgi:hypothetical protein
MGRWDDHKTLPANLNARPVSCGEGMPLKLLQNKHNLIDLYGLFFCLKTQQTPAFTHINYLNSIV